MNKDSGAHRLPLELLPLAYELHQEAGSLQVVPQPLPGLQLLLQRRRLLLALSLEHGHRTYIETKTDRQTDRQTDTRQI